MFFVRLHTFLAFCAAFVFVFLSCTAGSKIQKVQTKEWGAYYMEHLTPGARLISAGPNFTLERVPGRYLYKTYFYDTKAVTSTRYFDDKALNVQIGPCIRYTDYGIKFLESHYQNNALQGSYQQYDMLRGWKLSESHYEKGKLDGVYTTYDSTGLVREISHYEKGELDGVMLRFDAKGDTIIFEEYRKGNKIRQYKGPAHDPASEVMASFPCDSALISKGEKCSEFSIEKYLKDNIKYPDDAFKLNIQGKVITTFVIDGEGNVTRVVIPNGYCQSIRDECQRVINGMPKWNPGSSDGHPVKIKFTLPVGFWIR